MQIEGAVAVVTGGANGIGRALAQEFAYRNAAGVVVSDIDMTYARLVADQIGGVAVDCDVGDADQINALVAVARAEFGRIDIFCSNAGYSDPITWDLSQSMEDYERLTRVNLLAHVAAAKAVLPEMAERGSGYLLQTLSSAALTTASAAAGYVWTKHGALGFAEWITLVYGQQGVRVSCLCPNAVYTGMFGRPKDLDPPAVIPGEVPGLDAMMLPEDVATFVVDAMEGDEPFPILPHPKVAESFKRKADNYDEWIKRIRSRTQAMREAGLGS